MEEIARNSTWRRQEKQKGGENQEGEHAEIELRSGTEAHAGLVVMSEEALDTEDESVDPTFDLDSSIKSDVDHIVKSFCEDWVSHLDRDDRVPLGVLMLPTLEAAWFW